MKIFKYLEFISENNKKMVKNIPTYQDCVEMCSMPDSPFYESKVVVDGYNISIFNYRLAQWKDFVNPLEGRSDIKGHEMRGLTFVFNKDGTLFNRYILLEKFFNLNQVPDSMYSVVKNYKIKYINNKEDGSIASFIKLPNGNIVGKSKMSFDSDQAKGINRVYRKDENIRALVDWTLENDIVAIFEYVAPTNRIVLRYEKEELILLRLRDNKTGKHIDINSHLDKIGAVKIAPFEDDYKDLDHLVEVIAKKEDKEGVIVQAEDSKGEDFFFKLKTPWYSALHGLLTDDIYREHVIIDYILEDKIDDILGQIPENEKEAHDRINKIISIVKRELNKKSNEIQEAYDKFIEMGIDKKEYAIRFRKDPNFTHVMSMFNNGKDSYEIAKSWISNKTKRLLIAREWLKDKDPTLFFIDAEEDDN